MIHDQKETSFPRHQWSPLCYQADWRSLFSLSLLTVIFVVQMTGIFRHWLLILASGILTIIACNIKHNHMHSRMFRYRWMNRLLNHWLGLCTGTTTSCIITEHNERHHGPHNNTETDWVRCSLVSRYRSQWLKLLMFCPLAAGRLLLTKPSDLQRWRGPKPHLYHEIIQERLVLYSSYAALLLWDWKASLLYLALPLLNGQWWLFTFNLFQHQDMDHDDTYNNSRNVTSFWFNWIYLNIGFHSAHHLRPTLHWSLLPAFHKEQIEPFIDPRLLEPSAFSFYKNWFFNRVVLEKPHE